MTDFDPRYGEAVDLGNAIARITAPNAGPFTGPGTNSYLIGERRLMLLDPGPASPEHLDALVRAVAGRPVTHILISHTHRDHVDGLAAVREALGGVTVADPLRVDPVEGEAEKAFVDIAFRPDEPVGDGDVIDNGEVSVTAISTPGHARDHLAFAMGDDCFSGDHVMGWSTTVVAPPGGSMKDYIESLDRLLAMPQERYLPGHGDTIEEARRVTSHLRSHRLMREKTILNRLLSGERTVDELVAGLYVGIDPRLRRGAGMSVLAHLMKLEQEGHVRAEAGGGLEGRWVPV